MRTALYEIRAWIAEELILLALRINSRATVEFFHASWAIAQEETQSERRGAA